MLKIEPIKPHCLHETSVCESGSPYIYLFTYLLAACTYLAQMSIVSTELATTFEEEVSSCDRIEPTDVIGISCVRGNQLFNQLLHFRLLRLYWPCKKGEVEALWNLGATYFRTSWDEGIEKWITTSCNHFCLILTGPVNSGFLLCNAG